MGVTLSQFADSHHDTPSDFAYRKRAYAERKRITSEAIVERSLADAQEAFENRLPWERQAGEPLGAFHYFTIYRDLPPPERTYVNVRKAAGLKGNPRTPNNAMSAQAAKWRWQERVKAWDADQDRIRREAFEKERIEMAKRQARLGVTMQEKASEGLLYVDPEKLAPREITVLADTGVKIERLARGESTENISQKSVQIVFEGQRPDWLPPDSSL